ncbi:TonB-dependent receptor [Halosquirtibacter xylanolyticus]|uniref:TonB-dependent receptor n=1 Tax=Halosquirtibacter xylanolyticus TaxID=3374599 RepID=UPI0037493B16|nr:TonB-dependent receptor [Prolixibacteraceae bacterium]
MNCHKIKSYLLTIMCILMGVIHVNAKKSNVTIMGTVVSEEQPIQFATVALYTENKVSLLGGAITDEKGSFRIEAPKHNGYVLVVSSIGFEKQELTLNGNQPVIQKMIDLKTSVTSLSEVQVKGSAIQNKIDRDVVTITKSMREGAPTTNFLLRKTPGVDVDYLSEGITVDGKSNVLLLVDGVKKDVKYIQSLSSKRIDKMEIYRDANGRYAMEGFSAVINIILRKNYRGFSLSLEDKEVFSTNGNNGPNTRMQTQQYVQTDYTMDKLLVYGSFRHYKEDFYFEQQEDLQYGSQRITSHNLKDLDYNNYRQTGYLYGKAGLDYQITKKQKLGLQYSYNNDLDGANKDKRMFERWVYNDSNNENPDEVYQSDQYVDENGHTHDFQTTYMFDVSDRTKINMEGYYNRSLSDRWTEISTTNSLSGTIQNEDKQSDYFKGVAEWEQRLGKKTELSMGYNYIWKYSNDTIHSAVADQTTDSNFSLGVNKRKEIYHRVYGNINIPISKKFVTGFGYGAEWNKLGSATSFQVQHLPYARILYKPSTKLTVLLNYKVKTNNPYRSQTMNYDTYIDEFSLNRGNPNLKGYSTHRVEMGINMFRNKLRITPYYSTSDNAITTWGLGTETINGADKYVYTYVNADRYDKMGVVFSGNLKLSKRWLAAVMGSYNHYELAYGNMVQKENALLIRGQLIYQVAKRGLVFGAIYKNFVYDEPLLMGYRTTGNDMLSCLVMKRFKKSGINIMAYYGLPVGGDLFDYSLGQSWNDPRGVKPYRSDNFTDVTILKGIGMIKIGWRFNKGKVHKKMKRSDLEEKRDTSGDLGI